MALYDPSSLPLDDPRRLYGADPAVPGVPAPASPIGLDTRPLNPHGGGVDPTDPSAAPSDDDLRRLYGGAPAVPGVSTPPVVAALAPDPFPGAPKSWDTSGLGSAGQAPPAPKVPNVAAPAAPDLTSADPFPGAPKSWDTPAAPKVPSVSPVAPAAPAFDPSASLTAPASSLVDPSGGPGQVPSLPKTPTFAPFAPDLSDGSGVPRQPTGIAGLDPSHDFTKPLSQQPASVAGISRILDTPDPGSTSTGASVPLGQGSTATPNPSATAEQGGLRAMDTVSQDLIASDGTRSPVAAKPYSVGQDGAVKFNSAQPMTSLTTAYKDGAVSDADFKTLLPQAQAAEQAQADQQRLARENPAAWKAAASGFASGAAFFAGAAPGSGIGTEVGAGLGALTGPFAEVGVPVGGAIGNVVGGYIGGKLAGSAFDAAVAKAAQNNETIRSFQDASALHPYYNAAGGIAAAAAGIPKVGMQAVGGLLGADGAEVGTAASKLTDALQAARATEGAASVIDKAATLKAVFSPSNLRQAAAQGFNSGGGGLASTVSNLTQEAAIRAAQGASTADIAKIIGYRVGGASLGMLALDTALKEGSKALGFSQDGQTLPGAAQAALMGAFMSGHGLQFGETSPAQMANIVTRVGVRLKSGIPLDQPITAENLPPGVDNQQLAAIAPPLTPHEMVLSSQFDDQIKGLASQGKIDPNNLEQLVAAARQSAGKSVFHNGQRQASGVQVTPNDYLSPSVSAPATGPSTPATPLSLPGAPESVSPSQGLPDGGQTSLIAPASSSQPPRPSVPSDALIGLGKGDPASSPSTGASVAGQASSSQPTDQEDDKRRADSIATLTQARGGQQALLDKGLVAPEAHDATRAMVAHLSDQIAALHQPPPAGSAPLASSAARAPDAPAPASGGAPPATDLSASGSPAAGDTPPSPPVDGSLPVGASTSPSDGNPPSGADRMPATDQPPAPAPTAYHRRLADAVNSGALSDRDDGRPSTTFHVLSRLRNLGAEVTPETARDVSTGVSSILNDPSMDRDAKQAALKQLFRSNLPSEQHQDGGSSAPATSTSSPAPGSGAATATPAAGATPDPDDPQPIAAPRQTEDRVVPTPAGPKLIPADTDDVAEARTWLANQRDLGRNPASAEVARQTGVDFNTASRLRADQSAAEMRAAIPETPEVPHVKMGDQVQLDPKFPARTVTQLFPDGMVGITGADGRQLKVPANVALRNKVAPETPAAPAGNGTATPATKYSGVIGKKIDAKTTAFAPGSGTLGIPRPQMPQVAAEHRGAMAQFLQARGMDVSAQDEAPSSLKPSQAEFNPGKVAKAGAIREAGDATPRRILTSSDGHVIDGHHQWLDRLQNAPDEPMPTLKINAPARDILSQIHEFPSAGMEKAPDIVSAPGGESSQGSGESSAPTAPVERQPVTPAGKAAADIIKRLTGLQAEGKTLTEGQEKGLAEAQYLLAQDLNRQALGPNAQPATEAGKRALANLHQMETYKAKGMPLKPGDYETSRAMNRILEADRTAQREAIEAKQAQAPAPNEATASQTPVLSQNEPTPPANSSPVPASAPSAPASSTPAPAFKPRQQRCLSARGKMWIL